MTYSSSHIGEGAGNKIFAEWILCCNALGYHYMSLHHTKKGLTM